MSLLLPPPTPGSNSRDYSKDDDSDSDVSEDSAGQYISFSPQNTEKNELKIIHCFPMVLGFCKSLDL